MDMRAFEVAAAPVARLASSRVALRTATPGTFGVSTVLSDEEVTLMLTQLTDGAFRDSWHFWVPHLALMLGLRLSEVAQLHTDDLFEREGRWWLRIQRGCGPPLRDRPRRELPVCRQLEKLGLIELFQRADAEESQPLFPSLVASTRPGSAVHSRMERWRRLTWRGRRPSPTLYDLRLAFALRMQKAEGSLWFFGLLLGVEQRWPEARGADTDPVMRAAMVRAVDEANFPEADPLIPPKARSPR